MNQNRINLGRDIFLQNMTEKAIKLRTNWVIVPLVLVVFGSCVLLGFSKRWGATTCVIWVAIVITVYLIVVLIVHKKAKRLEKGELTQSELMKLLNDTKNEKGEFNFEGHSSSSTEEVVRNQNLQAFLEDRLSTV